VPGAATQHLRPGPLWRDDWFEDPALNDFFYSAATWLVPMIAAIVFHEVAHGYAANMLGDSTAADRGRLSLNPFVHVDPFGTIILPLMLAVAHAPVFGWAKPVPISPRRLRNPRLDGVLVALAGPMMNLFMAALATVALGAFAAWQGEALTQGLPRFVAVNLINFLMINIFLCIFNLLPIPPFDGSHVVAGLLPPPLAARYAQIGRYGLLVMILLIWVLPEISPRLDVVGRVVGPIADGIARLFLGGVNLA
jgi:Zn-dependent protease